MVDNSHLAVVIPAFEASRTIGSVISRIQKVVPGATILVVNDGSEDDTADVARAAGAMVASHEHNLGKGRALAQGLHAATAFDVRYIITIDADGQHPPEAIPALLEPLAAGTADLVVGARPRDPHVMPAGRRFTNWLSSTLVTRLTSQPVPDSQSGYRAMRREVAERVQPPGVRYEYETQFLIDAAGQGFRLGAVAVPAVYEGEESHFRYISDTMRLFKVFLTHWRGLIIPTHDAPRTTHP